MHSDLAPLSPGNLFTAACNYAASNPRRLAVFIALVIASPCFIGGTF